MNEGRIRKELMGIYAVWWREFKVFQREKSRIVSSIVQPLMWLFLFGSGVGASVSISNINYQDYIYPGILAMLVLLTWLVTCMLTAQREMAGQGGAVLDGRDIGTVVFPGADLKFFLDADPRCRALRRGREQQASGESISLDAVEREIRERDHRDATRADSPLLAARDALRLDTTDLSPARVLDRMLAAVEARRRATPVEVGGPGSVTRPEPPSPHHVCPWWLGYWLVSPLRRLLEDPDRILDPYLTPGMTVLDVGCGMGFFSLPMARLLGPSGRVHCVDLQARMLSGLERRARKAGLSERIVLHRCGDRSLELEGLKGRVGFELAHSVVHEVPSPSHLMAELADLLTAAGRLLLAEPRLHVSEPDFESELALAAEAGLGVTERPRLRGSRAAVLRRVARPQ